jgi:DNA (cytosine-5)-methyltransferase 1
LGATTGKKTLIAFSYKDNGADATSDLSPTIRAGNHDKSHANSGQPPAIAYAFKAATRVLKRVALVAEEQSPTLTSASSGTNLAPAVMHGVAVRRLTPIECERLQGFPDNHTLIGWRGKDADECPDGPRYKAIGNSMAVPVMRWIGERIAAALPAEKLNGDYGGSKTPLDQRDLWRTPPALSLPLMLSSAFNLMPPRRRITRCAGSSSPPSRTRWKRRGLIT